jgi:hypothetical protein
LDLQVALVLLDLRVAPAPQVSQAAILVVLVFQVSRADILVVLALVLLVVHLPDMQAVRVSRVQDLLEVGAI